MIVTLRIPEHAAHLLGQMLRDERTRLARLGLVVMALAFHQEQEDGSSLDALENLDAAISALQTWQETMGKDYATALRSLRRVRDQLAEARRALHPEVE
jgi:dienelactone hydrolase